MKVTEALRSSRIAAGMTQRQLADMLGVTPTFISDIEAERRSIGEKYLALMPETMRIAVAAAMVGEHQAAITRIAGSSEQSPSEAA